MKVSNLLQQLKLEQSNLNIVIKFLERRYHEKNETTETIGKIMSSAQAHWSPRKKKSKKPHWTQTAKGKKKLAERMKKVWKDKKEGAK